MLAPSPKLFADSIQGLFINMANGLIKAGPGSFLIGFLIWAAFMWAVNECFGTTLKLYISE